MNEKSWDTQKIPDFKKGLELLLKEKSEFSKHYLSVLNDCLRNYDYDFCTKEGSRDSIGYDRYSYIKDSHNAEKYNKIKKEIETNIKERSSIYRAISTCHFDELTDDLEKYGKTKRRINREEYVDIGKYWSWSLDKAFPYWGTEKCYGTKQKEPIHAVVTGRIVHSTSINLPETFAANMLFGSDEEEITLKEGSIMKIEKVCAYPQRFKGETLKAPLKCKLINKFIKI